MQLAPPILQPTSPIDSVALAFERATFVFTAQVVRVHGTTTPSVRPANAVVVLPRTGLDTVFVSPRGMRPINGRKITVVVGPMSPLSVGDSALFFAYGVADDEGLAVRPIAQMANYASRSGGVTQLLANARERLRDDTVRALLGRATLVLTGTVDSVVRVPRDSSQRVRKRAESEAWRQAFFHIRTSLKGGTVAPGSTLRVLYRADVDRQRDQPLLARGQQYLLGVRRMSTTGGAGRQLNVGSALYFVEASDVRGVADTSRVARVKP